MTKVQRRILQRVYGYRLRGIYIPPESFSEDSLEPEGPGTYVSLSGHERNAAYELDAHGIIRVFPSEFLPRYNCVARQSSYEQN